MRRAPGGPGNLLWRSELLRLGTEVFGHQRDANRIVIEWLRENSKPTDEILVNYEDIPLLYYLPNPVRGGIAAVLRRSVPFVHWSVFIREMNRLAEQINQMESVRAQLLALKLQVPGDANTAFRTAADQLAKSAI